MATDQDKKVLLFQGVFLTFFSIILQLNDFPYFLLVLSIGVIGIILIITGIMLHEDNFICPNCGWMVHGRYAVCQNCGYQINDMSKNS